MPRKSTGHYPDNWREIANAVKERAAWQCVRCGHPHDIASGHMLTVHHLDLNKSNCAWWNLAALCQKCHLHIQGKVLIERPWIFEHSEWFKPYVAGRNAHLRGLPDDRESVLANLESLVVGMCAANHPVYSTCLCDKPFCHAGPHSALIRIGVGIGVFVVGWDVWAYDLADTFSIC